MLEFFVLTPLPGSEDHKGLTEKGVWMDPDMNKYDAEHVVTAHAKMSPDEWQQMYRAAWSIFYSPDHLETVLRRAYACGARLSSLMPLLFIFSSAVEVEGVHPLQWGIFRIKHRLDRRAGMPVESPLAFYARYTADIACKAAVLAKRWRELKRVRRKIEADASAKLYRDEALTPVAEQSEATRELYTQSHAARSAVERELRVAGRALGGNGTARRSGVAALDARQPEKPGLEAAEPRSALRPPAA
jgi:hypothetical protein